jgi:hypothetical protein
MALMRVEIDKRTIAGLTSLDVATFAHGLLGAPHAVLVRFVLTVGAATSWYSINAQANATNVTLQNIGNTPSNDFEVCTLRYHSLIQ